MRSSVDGPAGSRAYRVSYHEAARILADPRVGSMIPTTPDKVRDGGAEDGRPYEGDDDLLRDTAGPRRRILRRVQEPLQGVEGVEVIIDRRAGERRSDSDHGGQRVLRDRRRRRPGGTFPQSSSVLEPVMRATLWKPWRGGSTVHCCLCAHHCRIAPGERGLCGVRENRDGILYALTYGPAHLGRRRPHREEAPVPLPARFPQLLDGDGGLQLHLPRSARTPTSGRCRVTAGAHRGGELAPAEVVDRALPAGCASISYTYTEPTIFFEYARDTACWPGSRAQERLRDERVHDRGGPRAHRGRSGRGERRPQVVLRRLLPADLRRAAEAGARHHQAHGRRGGLARGHHPADPGPNDAEDDLRGARGFLWPRSTRTSPGTSPGSTHLPHARRSVDSGGVGGAGTCPG